MGLAALYDIPAPAKLNLFLHVVGRRADGYHLLQSVFALIDWCDTLHVERRADGALRRHDLGPALPTDDLTLRAARALKQASGTPLGADISVLKRVPSGAGLGGGSSDAASTLLALNRLWGLNWTRGRLLTLALPLGADVPFFIEGHNAFVKGIGERLTPVTLPRQWLAVVKPEQAIPTAAIFGSALLGHSDEAAILSGFLEGAGVTANATDTATVSALEQLYGNQGRNDLQAAAQAHCPEVTEVAAWLESRFGASRMSGSGSAVFSRAGTGDQPVATWRADELPARWVGRMCRSLDHHPLVGWAD
ncbi:MAG: 4-(cytidine 5'-diphospho)-2-C-methyl-D-erythritol kinase [Burkholderiales bacterium]|nr:4-(cytidine 5'-diphospho)-2-C-methyl-D-erythritol kinase [Burkholderiales bacterium]